MYSTEQTVLRRPPAPEEERKALSHGHTFASQSHQLSPELEQALLPSSYY